jgi:hypothetical protein
VILCGAARYPAGFAEAVTGLAARLDAPLIAEALSNLRFGAHDISRIIAHAAHFLMRAELPAPAWVLRFGAFPVSRVLERWLASLTASEHLLVAPPGAWPDPLWQCGAPLRGDPLTTVESLAALCRPASAEFHHAWAQAEADAARALAHRCQQNTTLSEGCVARAALDAAPEGAQLFIGNSLAMRAVDRYGGKSGKRLTLYGNRGASGINGNLATAAGIAHATGAPTLALIGDQTLLHDCGSLALAARHDLGIVLLDNGGGGTSRNCLLPPRCRRRCWSAASSRPRASTGRASPAPSGCVTSASSAAVPSPPRCAAASAAYCSKRAFHAARLSAPRQSGHRILPPAPGDRTGSPAANRSRAPRVGDGLDALRDHRQIVRRGKASSGMANRIADFRHRKALLHNDLDAIWC